jgi:hypothetical protein
MIMRASVFTRVSEFTRVSMFVRVLMAVAVGAALMGLVGCDDKPAATKTAAAPGVVLPASLFLAGAPADAKDIKDAKPTLKAGDKVVLAGRIGGSREPFVSGRAVFTLVDPRLKTCADDPADTCKTPWDYCCEAPEDLNANMATVQVVGAEGQPLKTGLDGVHGLKPLAKVTVVGTVAKADSKNLLVRAEGIFVAE